MDFKILLPKNIVFGDARLLHLTELLAEFGKNVLLVTGRSSFLQSENWTSLSRRLEQHRISYEIIQIPGEPSPEMIDKAVKVSSKFNPDVVVAIGGGSVLDAGKAISAMIPLRTPVKDFLEGVGNGRMHSGDKVPYIAIPTTAGTGSEATKNAVISQVGKSGFKKSLRHNNFIPDIALIDPELAIHCPENITAWSGMDAFTQLLESYLSTNANAMTDGIALSGLDMVSRYLERAVGDGSDLEARAGMAYAALCSGITLANAGLGVIHGFASSIGGRFAIPHGLICASLMGVSNELTLNKLLKEEANDPAIKKYIQVGKIFYGSTDRDDMFYAEFLLNKIHDLSIKFSLPRLGEFGFEIDEIDNIVSQTSHKNNPAKLSKDELKKILETVA
jgi:alcohol dehydrogenase class IV